VHVTSPPSKVEKYYVPQLQSKKNIKSVIVQDIIKQTHKKTALSFLR
jgi:hypothetical protein